MIYIRIAIVEWNRNLSGM